MKSIQQRANSPLQLQNSGDIIISSSGTPPPTPRIGSANSSPIGSPKLYSPPSETDMGLSSSSSYQSNNNNNSEDSRSSFSSPGITPPISPKRNRHSLHISLDRNHNSSNTNSPVRIIDNNNNNNNNNIDSNYQAKLDLKKKRRSWFWDRYKKASARSPPTATMSAPGNIFIN